MAAAPGVRQFGCESLDGIRAAALVCDTGAGGKPSALPCLVPGEDCLADSIEKLIAA
jgi:hypothetical protein